MDATQSHIKVHGISPEVVGDFIFDYDADSSDVLTELVPDLDNWGNAGWMEVEEFEYDGRRQIMNFTLETKWVAPTDWLRAASDPRDSLF